MTIMLILALFAAFSLAVVGATHISEQRAKANELLLKQRKQRVLSLLEIQWAIEPLLEKLDVIKVFNGEVLRVIGQILISKPDDIQAQSYLTDTEQVLNELKQGKRRQPLNRVKANDAEVDQAKYCLNLGLTLVHSPHMVDQIGSELSNQLIHELNWALLMVELITKVAHGHMAKSANNPVIAIRCYKEALILIHGSSIIDPRKEQIIEELNAILRGKQLALSREFMPENSYNPKVEPEPKKP